MVITIYEILIDKPYEMYSYLVDRFHPVVEKFMYHAITKTEGKMHHMNIHILRDVLEYLAVGMGMSRWCIYT
jgi:hypothetical protein